MNELTKNSIRKKITGEIKKISKGQKTYDEVNIIKMLKPIKNLNKKLYMELLEKYTEVLENILDKRK